MPSHHTPTSWLTTTCLLIDGQFVFLDPLWWDTHLLSAGAVEVLRQAARAAESGELSAFSDEVDAAGGWPPALKQLAFALASLQQAGAGEGDPN